MANGDSEKTISEQDSSEQLQQSESTKEKKTSAGTEKTFFTRSTREATFDDKGLEEYYAPIGSYEGRHRYDPRYQWEHKEEKRLVRKVCIRSSCASYEAHGIQIDWKICTWVCLMFFALQLDRGNISQALSDNMLDDLGIGTNDYNTGQTIFYVSFLFAELPSQLISKKIGNAKPVSEWKS